MTPDELETAHAENVLGYAQEFAKRAEPDDYDAVVIAILLRALELACGNVKALVLESLTTEEVANIFADRWETEL